MDRGHLQDIVVYICGPPCVLGHLQMWLEEFSPSASWLHSRLPMEPFTFNAINQDAF